MILQVYTIYDKQVSAFMQPFFCRSRGEAVRSFTDAVNDPKSQFYRYAADYSLMFHGEWDDHSGLFAGVDPIRIIGANEVLTDMQSPSLVSRG